MNKIFWYFSFMFFLFLLSACVSEIIDDLYQPSVKRSDMENIEAYKMSRSSAKNVLREIHSCLEGWTLEANRSYSSYDFISSIFCSGLVNDRIGYPGGEYYTKSTFRYIPSRNKYYYFSSITNVSLGEDSSVISRIPILSIIDSSSGYFVHIEFGRDSRYFGFTNKSKALKLYKAYRVLGNLE